MKRLFSLLKFTVLLTILSCQSTQQPSAFTVTSPSKVNQINFDLSEDGQAFYVVSHNNSAVIDTSFISFDFKDQKALKDNFKVLNSRSSSFNETWEMPWGEQREVLNNYNELILELEEKKEDKRRLNLHFRVYDDGIGFRYEFPTQKGVDSLIIMEENTEFQLTGDHTTWWLPADWDSYEHLYNTTPFSEIDAIERGKKHSLGHTSIKDNAVHTPVTMKSAEGVYLSFHEASLLDYASMTLKVDPEKLKMTSQLVGSDRLGYKVKRALPFSTPWRTIQISDKATDLIESKLILNLNEPNKIGDVSWFKPKKYMGIWWEMHVDKGSWDYGMTQDENGKWIDIGKAHGRHSATTENAKRYIDFASANGITGLLVEGWNTG